MNGKYWNITLFSEKLQKKMTKINIIKLEI